MKRHAQLVACEKQVGGDTFRTTETEPNLQVEEEHENEDEGTVVPDETTDLQQKISSENSVNLSNYCETQSVSSFLSACHSQLVSHSRKRPNDVSATSCFHLPSPSLASTPMPPVLSNNIASPQLTAHLYSMIIITYTII